MSIQVKSKNRVTLQIRMPVRNDLVWQGKQQLLQTEKIIARENCWDTSMLHGSPSLTSKYIFKPSPWIHSSPEIIQQECCTWLKKAIIIMGMTEIQAGFSSFTISFPGNGNYILSVIIMSLVIESWSSINERNFHWHQLDFPLKRPA